MDHKRFSGLLGLALLIPNANVLAQSQCASAAGNWSSNIMYQFNFAQNSGLISGSVTASASTLCPQKVWASAGTFLGSGQFTVQSNHPTGGNESCAAWVRWQGTVAKPGCHTGSGSWNNSDGASGQYSFSKPCDVPTGESTASVEWDMFQPTVHVWDATLSPSSINFDGRTVTEGGTSSDSCWFPGSGFAEVVAVQGPNPADINGNGYRDRVGWIPGAVTYYRAQGRAPCDATSVQQMRIDCSTSNPVYINNGLVSTIGVTTVGSSRSGQTQTRTWP